MVFFFSASGGGDSGEEAPLLRAKGGRRSLFADRHKNPEKSRAPKRKEEIRDEGRKRDGKGEVLIAG